MANDVLLQMTDICKPVSYTHLDVYKRQMQARCTVGVSRTVGALSDCHTAYREAIGVLAYPCLLYTSRCV